jgi:hypothetical protein
MVASFHGQSVKREKGQFKDAQKSGELVLSGEIRESFRDHVSAEIRTSMKHSLFSRRSNKKSRLYKSVMHSSYISQEITGFINIDKSDKFFEEESRNAA